MMRGDPPLGQPVRRFDEEVERPVHVTRYQYVSPSLSLLGSPASVPS